MDETATAAVAQDVRLFLEERWRLLENPMSQRIGIGPGRSSQDGYRPMYPDVVSGVDIGESPDQSFR